MAYIVCRLCIRPIESDIEVVETTQNRWNF